MKLPTPYIFLNPTLLEEDKQFEYPTDSIQHISSTLTTIDILK